MDHLRNCRSCGRVFADTEQVCCPACLEAEEQEFEKVRAYLKEHPGASVEQTSQATEVDVDRILRFVRQGRVESEGLVVAPESACEECGAAIVAKRVCPACQEKLVKDLQALLRPRSEREAAKPDDPPPCRRDPHARGGTLSTA